VKRFDNPTDPGSDPWSRNPDILDPQLIYADATDN